MADPPLDKPQDSLARLRHQLRTPLNHILGYSELLIDEVAEEGPAALLPDLKQIQRAATTLLALLNALLDSERIGAERMDFAAAKQAPEMTPLVETEGADAVTIPGRVLAVDDDQSNRDVLTRLLRRLGHTVAEAADGEQALEAAGKQEFDVILLDIMMPVLDGFETLRRLKADERLCHLPVVMISASDEMDSVVRCIQMGADDYLFKPINATLLQARLTSTLDKKRLHDMEQSLYRQLQENFGRLQELERMRDDMTGMIVHDLRTPLTALLSGMQTMPLLGEMNASQEEFLALATTGGETLLHMINDLLDVSKMEDGSLVLACEAVDAADVVARAAAQVLPLIQENNQSLVCDVPADAPPIWADADKIRRVLINLLGNAIKFTPAGGVIALTVQPHADGMALFRVTDTGMGIPKEAFERIFEKFGQVAAKDAGRRMSTGLGLTFCKMTVELHGGRIWVESEPGAGSAFLFTIPVAASASPDAAPQAE